MATEDKKRAEAAPASGLGLSGLSMNEIAPQATTEPSEVGRRAGKKWVWILVVLAAVAVAGVVLRLTLNLPPGAAAQQQIERSPAVARAVQQGLVRQLVFLSGSRLRVDFSPNLSLTSETTRSELRQLARSILQSAIEALPGRDLAIVGFQGDHQMLEGRYLDRSALVNKAGERELDITVRVEGDPQGGVQQGLSGRGSLSN